MLKQKLNTVAKELYKNIKTWPRDQGLLNHLLYSLEYVKNKKVDIFDYRYNSSAYNNTDTYDKIKLLHYHDPQTLAEALNHRAIS
jgi:hypothetical protein